MNIKDSTNEPLRPANLRAYQAIIKRQDGLRTSMKAHKSQGIGDIVHLSNQAEKLATAKKILEEAYAKLESQVSPEAAALFDEHGKTEYLQGLAEKDDNSPEAVSDNIVGGITGYIFGAFAASRESMTSDDFDEFESAVWRGFERGLSEATGVLEDFGVLDDSMEGTIGSTAKLSREKLVEWFKERREEFFGQAVSDEAQANVAANIVGSMANNGAVAMAA